MRQIKLMLDNIFQEAARKDFDALKDKMERCNRMLHDGTGKGSDHLGWVNLSASYTEAQLEDIAVAAEKFRKIAQVVIVIGIGGSYLGAKAILEALSGNFDWLMARKGPVILFGGQNLNEDYIHELLEGVRDRSIATVVISKSGTTIETAIAFRVIREEIEKRYGKEGARERIVAVTSEHSGALREIARKEGYVAFPVAENVGGRYSVLTAVGLVPLAIAGIDVRELLRGATRMMEATSDKIPFEENPAARYAAARYLMYHSLNKKIEILAGYEPKLRSLAEWWKQLFGESEGKDGKGLFPASVTYPADLHSIGQYIQSGERIMFETVLSIKEHRHPIHIRKEEQDADDLNYLANRRISEINRMAEYGAALAHVDGGVPNIRIEIEQINEYCLGGLLYFFEKACGISGYALGVNPFDQPGVEAYKQNMLALLDKPGYEEQKKSLLKRIESLK